MPPSIREGAQPVDAFPPDLGGEDRAETTSPEPDRFVAHIDPALVQKVLHIPQREREAEVHHHRQADSVWAAREILERVAL